jgi:hypothetical protein
MTTTRVIRTPNTTNVAASNASNPDSIVATPRGRAPRRHRRWLLVQRDPNLSALTGR